MDHGQTKQHSTVQGPIAIVVGIAGAIALLAAMVPVQWALGQFADANFHSKPIVAPAPDATPQPMP